MDTIIKLAVLALTGAVAALAVKQRDEPLGFLVSLSAGVVILLAAAGCLEQVVDLIRDLANISGMSDGLLSPLFKVAGISVVARISCELCRDADEEALALKLELAAVLLSVVAAMPLFSALLSLMKRFL
jgi:stage III sporulation protein AD